jgi:phospholipase C
MAAGITISTFSPRRGAVGVGVTLNGSGFSSATQVLFHGVAADFAIESDEEIVTSVPSGATTGRITVASSSASARTATGFIVIPIQHIVVLYQENQSFDHVLGKICVDATAGTMPRAPCEGATEGKLPDGSTIPLAPAPDYIPDMGHSVQNQTVAIHGGRMDGWGNMKGCTSASNYACYTQYFPPADQADSSIPNITSFAQNFAVADQTFFPDLLASWVSHNNLVSATKDDFYGNSPIVSKFHAKSHGQGCDSFEDALWTPPTGEARYFVPACIPDKNGFGPYRSSPVEYVPTIMDRMDAAGRSWQLDAATGPAYQGPRTGYSWTTCPAFAECLYSDQVNNFYPHEQLLNDARDGTLPNLSLVVPTPPISQHNNNSMAVGDNWLGEAVGALMDGPEWNSTAVFITWDDCGCFYDHVPAPAGTKWTIRAPMIIISPYAKPGYTDSTPTSLNGILAFVEHAYGLPPLTQADAAAYDFRGSFDFSQKPLGAVETVRTRLPRSERVYLRENPAPPDET